jgi:RHH-type proline utilization regulon transcriptional repressor/proline dehydrogenase/delta 1-pyrroline-5-carboxylate dehydrogenase
VLNNLTYIDELYDRDEALCVQSLINTPPLSAADRQRAETIASDLVKKIRESKPNSTGISAFMTQYNLSSKEGIILMCLAEALLRIPDKATIDHFIADQLSSAAWDNHLGKSKSLFVNAGTWGLLLTGKVLKPSSLEQKKMATSLRDFLQKHSKAFIRKVIMHAMKILGQQFVMATSIEKAMKNAAKLKDESYLFSYDMLGEAAMNETDAARYFEAYHAAIETIGKFANSPSAHKNPGVSVKLSALYSRYRLMEYDNVIEILYPRLKALAVSAKHYNIGFTVDAEEAYRLTLSLDLFEKLAHEPELNGWQGLGLAVQAYQKRAPKVLEFLATLAEKTQRRFMVRLVKGAYWDSEIKYAQENGFAGYPVYTRKVYTDVSYLALAKYMLKHSAQFYCQFASHNAHTLAAIVIMANNFSDFEFQRLHGMGEALYREAKAHNIPCRVYAPIGSFEHLLAYLVRRLLENGANSSFVNNISNEKVSIIELIADPIQQAEKLAGKPNVHIPLPASLYGSVRKNADGINLDNLIMLNHLEQQLQETYKTMPWSATPLIDNATTSTEIMKVHNPAKQTEIVGTVQIANQTDVANALTAAETAFANWRFEPVINNAERLEKVADLIEENMPRLMAITIKEAGKTYNNAIAEFREAIDFCRYYATEAKRLLSEPTYLSGPTGETNYLRFAPRGIIVCISPWNFPAAIFIGEVTAALATGNVVIAKPAEQTSIIAYEMVQLLHQAGFPKNVVQLLPGPGESVGAEIIKHPAVNGVIFTGSTDTARLINITLANKPGPIVPLIAETGGQNCMLVDSSALHEQVVRDVLRSAFDSAGQRCSALRVLFLQDEIADPVINMLKGAMDDLVIGDPVHLSTDIGPVIDQEAQQILLSHIEKLKPHARHFYQCKPTEAAEKGTFVLPTLIEIDNLQQLPREVFGPVCHVIRFQSSELKQTLQAINSTGYGLTFGIHSRIQANVELAKRIITAGNIYVNRNMVGAIVGCQPFGGEGLSGTGPKAGGPHYLPRLCLERSYSTDTTAAGGNASLMGLGEI